MFDPRRSIPQDGFRWSLSVSLRGCSVPHFVAVHAADGTEPGLYRWPMMHTPIRSGPLRSEPFRLCAEQELGRDAAFVVIAAGKRCCEPVVYPDVERGEAVRMAAVAKAYYFLIPRCVEGAVCMAS